MAAVSLKCPNCDAELLFDPDTQKYKCEYCNSLFSAEELEKMKPEQAAEEPLPGGGDVSAGDSRGEQGTAAASAENSRGEQRQERSEKSAVVYSCPSCGAQIVTDETTAATFCFYCHNPVILEGQLAGEYSPDAVIPFEIGREKAEEAFLSYIKKKWFVPRGFFGKKNLEKMTGVYFPYWLYDAEVEGDMDAEAKKIRIWRRGETEFTETRVYQILRRGEVKLDNLPEKALQKADLELAEGVLPYDFDHMKAFELGYLSGFFAEKRDIESEQLQEQMRQEMRQDAQRLFRESIVGYENVRIRSSEFRVSREGWKYVLLPVWTLTYKGGDGKIYYYSMNGQNGRVCGKLPVDWKRLLAFAAGVFALTLILVLTGGAMI